MKTYSTLEIESVVGIDKFYKLLINEKCPFDEFVDEFVRNYRSEIDSIFYRMNRKANRESLSSDKFRKWQSCKTGTECFEIKTVRLRVFMIKPRNDYVIISGCKKSKQKKMFNRFQNIAIDYLESNNLILEK